MKSMVVLGAQDGPLAGDVAGMNSTKSTLSVTVSRRCSTDRVGSVAEGAASGVRPAPGVGPPVGATVVALSILTLRTIKIDSALARLLRKARRALVPQVNSNSKGYDW